MLSDFDLRVAAQNLHKFDPEQKERVLALLEERDRLARLTEARQQFIPFVKAVWPGFIAGAHHNIMADAFQRVAEGKLRRLIIDMPPRFRLSVSTPIATTEGWKTMATVQPGDYVFSPTGAPVLVTGKSAVYEEDLYEVETTDGQIVECDATHLWSVRWGGTNRPFVTMSTGDIQAKSLDENWSKNDNLPKLPLVSPVEYPERNLLVPPYVLGAWLGDGASDSGTMAAHPDDEAFIRQRFEAGGIETTDVSGRMMFGTKTLRVKFRELGVLNNKHIPEEYLTACTSQRLALMQGLMDTDGAVSAQGKCTFHNSNIRLAQDFMELVHSFGLKARMNKRQTHYKGVPSKPSYRISFKMAGAASLPRKAVRCRAINGNFARSIAIRKTDRRGPVQCLEVANADGLFLAGRGYVPTHNTKSQFASWLLPAWFLGKFPDKQIIQVSNTESLAAGFGRQVRNIVGGEGERDDKGQTPYQNIFPDISLAKDSQAAAEWHTNKNGRYFAVGVNGKVTGKGADIAIVDDPHSEQEAKQAETSPGIFDAAYEWYTSGIRQRLQPGGAIIIVMTRWSKRDIVGQVLKKMEADIADGKKEGTYDEWEVIELPAILDEGTPQERSMWPGFWSLDELQATRNALPVSKWQAQYQQKPTSEEGAIIKRESWRLWGADDETCPGPQHAGSWARLEPPACDYTISSWDTALKKNQRADYSAMTTWGVFEAEDRLTGRKTTNVILLAAYKARLEFPELKRKVRQFYNEDLPDTLLIEDKGSGTSLIQELRSMGVPVQNFSYGRGGKAVSNDKVARANMISDIFASGYVWRPERRFAEEVMVECAEFPHGEHDDYVDSVVQAMLRFRNGGFIRTTNDEDEDEDAPRYVRKKFY